MAYEMLKQLYLFRELEPADLELVDRRAAACQFEPGDRVFSENDEADALYVVKKGLIQIRHQVEPDCEILIASLSVGSHFGEMGFLDRSKRSASALCIEPAELVQIVYEDLGQLCEDYPDIAVKMYRSMARFLAARLRMTTKKFSTAKEATFLLV